MGWLKNVVSNIMALSDVKAVNKRVDYIVQAALNNDFSYRFPTKGVYGYRRDINITLNRLVEHIEKMKDEARQNERFLGEIINLIDTGIIVANSEGHVLFVNKASLTILSIPVLTNLKQLPSDMSFLSTRKTLLKINRDTLTVVTINDINRNLQQAEIESLEKLIRVLSHEIMNSLTPITSIAETIESEEINRTSENSNLQQQMSVIASSSRSLMAFVKNFRKFTMLPEPSPEVLYIKPFVEGVATMAQGFENASAIRFTTSIFPPDAMMYTDGNMLNLVMVNLLKNAVEAGCKKVEIESRIRSNEIVEISVTNDGSLIDETTSREIFTPFFTTKAGGRGIGLSLSRRIVARLGGTLTLTTTPSTRFTILL